MDSFAPVQAGQVGTEPFYLIEMFIERDVCGAELRYETICPYRSTWSAGCCLWSPFAHTAVRPPISFSIGPVGMGTVLLH